MSVISNNQLAGAAGQGGSGYKIDNSLRFNSGDSAHLKRTFGSGNRKTWTLSFWVKGAHNTTTDNRPLMTYGTASDADYLDIKFTTAGGLQMSTYSTYYINTTAVFRDSSAWYHIVIAVDTTQSTAADRVKLYVNGVDTTRGGNDPTEDQEFGINNNQLHVIGAYANASGGSLAGSNFYLADYHFVDGQRLAATNFGEYDDNNVWQPKEFTGSYTTSGFTPGANISYGSWANVFNGSTTGHAFTYSSATSTATLSPGIAWSSKVRIYGLQYTTSHVKINGGSALTGFSSTAAWVDVTSQVGSSGTLSSVEINDVGTNYFKLFAIELDDTILDLSQAGVNGFYLDFSDNSSNAALGKNSAVADDFTSTVGALTTTQAADFYSAGSNPANNLFDGSTSTIVYGGYNTSSTNSDLIWTPNGAYSASSSLRVYVGYYTTIYVNGVSKATGGQSSAPAWVTLSHTGSITSIKFENTSNANVVRASAIEIDGTNVETTAWTVNNFTAKAPSGKLYSQATGSATSAFSSSNLVGAFPAFSTGGNYIYDAELNTSVTTVTFNYKYGFGGVEILVSNDGTNWTSKGTQTQAYTTISDSSPFKYVRWFIAAVWGHGITDDPANTDSLIDTPTNYEADSGNNNGGNYCTLNPLHHLHGATLANGNLQTTSDEKAFSTFLLKTGKWYVEHKIDAAGYNLCFSQVDHPSGATPSSGSSKSIGWYIPNGYVYWGAGYSGSLGGTTMTGIDSSGYMTSAAVGDIVAAAIDMDNSTIKFYKNGTEVGSIDFSTGSAHRFTEGMYISQFSGYGVWNFGQRAYAYTAPSGYKSLCTQNLEDPTIADGSTAFDTKTYTGTGNALNITGLNFSPDLVWIKNRSSGYSHCLYDTVRGVGKRLASDGTYGEDTYNLLTNFNAYGFSLGSGFVQNASGVTSVAWTWDGGDLASSSDTTNYDQSQTWTSYVTGTASPSYGITNLFNGDGTGLSYSDGTAATVGNTLTFQPSTAITGVNTLVLGTYGNIAFTVNGTSVSAPSSLGLEVTIDKSTYFSNGVLSNISWSYTNGSNYMYLTYIKINGKLLINPGVIPAGSQNNTIASTVRANPSAGFSIASWNFSSSLDKTIGHGLNAAPKLIIIKNVDTSEQWYIYTTAVDGTLDYGDFSTGSFSSSSRSLPTSSVFNYSGTTGDHIAYCFAPVEGYSAFGSYTGNGSTDGPFVYTGFRPAFILLKNSSDSSTYWTIHDNKRLGYNPDNDLLFPNTSDAENVTSYLDILSNGFKLRISSSFANASSKTFVYAAFAEHPFKTARAR